MKSNLIDVKDSKNPERLLGRLHFRPDCEVREGTVIRSNFFPLSETRAAYSPASYNPFRDVIRVTFNVAYRSENDGLLRVAELRTDTPLGVLLMMREFRLPGETEEAADRRHYFQKYQRAYGLR